jgi:transposase
VPRDGITGSNNIIVRSLRELKLALRATEWPEYECKKSNHVFTQHQLLALLVLRQRLSKSYREFASWLKVMDGVMRELAMDCLPHFTTLQKFAKRVGRDRLDRLMSMIARRHVRGGVTAAVDSTGFSCGYASRYFIHTISVVRSEGDRMIERGVRRHVKQQAVIDVDSQMILALDFRYGPCNDFNDAIPVLAKAASTFDVSTVLADKGYDSEEIRRFIIKDLKASTQIPTRKPQKRAAEIHGFLRRMQASTFDEGVYHQRSLVETMHSASKRVMGEAVRARGQDGQWKELTIRGVTYNLWKAGAFHWS